MQMTKLKIFIRGLIIVTPLLGLLIYVVQRMDDSRTAYNNELNAILLVVVIYLIYALLFNQKFKRFLGIKE